MNVVGRWLYSSVSFDAIQTKRGDSIVSFGRRPAFTKCQRSTASAVAQPTQDPVEPWSPIFHQSSRKSTLAGIAAGAAARPADVAVSKVQSFSCFGEGRQFRMRFGCALRGVVRLLRFLR